MRFEIEKSDIENIAREVVQMLGPLLSVKTETHDEIFDVPGLAAYLKATPKWIYNHLSDLPHFKIDGLLRFRKQVIDRFFELNPAKLPKV